MLRRTLWRVSLFLLVFVLIWAAAVALDAAAEPQAFRPQPAALAATLPSRGGLGGAAEDGAPREMIACAAAVVTLAVIISMIGRGRDGGGAEGADRSTCPGTHPDGHR